MAMKKAKAAAKKSARAAAHAIEDVEADLDQLSSDGDLDAETAAPARRKGRMIEVKRTLRYAKAYQYPAGHPLAGTGRVFAPGEEEQIPDDFPEGPHWSDYPLDGFDTTDRNGKPASLVPEGIDPSSIGDNVRAAESNAEMVRIRKQALATLGPQGVRGLR